jgi:hypothetical protein
MLQVTSHTEEHLKSADMCTLVCVYLKEISLSPTILLLNHGHEHSYLSWCDHHGLARWY